MHSWLVLFFFQSSFPSTPISRRALQRTLSDESIYSSQREHFFPSRASLLDQALPNDVLFTSTYPSLPKSLPLRRPSYTLGMKSLHGKWNAASKLMMYVLFLFIIVIAACCPFFVVLKVVYIMLQHPIFPQQLWEVDWTERKWLAYWLSCLRLSQYLYAAFIFVGNPIGIHCSLLV